MRAEFFLVLALALLVSAVPAPEAERDGPALAKRACVVNGCLCQPGTASGVYCYGCSQVLIRGNSSVFSGDQTSWVFQCDETGGCCAYGPRDSCAGGQTNPCGSA